MRPFLRVYISIYIYIPYHFANILFLKSSRQSGTSANIVTIAVEDGYLRYHNGSKWTPVQYNGSPIYLIDNAWYTVKAVNDYSTKTTKYEHVLPALIAIEQDRSVEGLLILLNTMGGDVEAGLAIAEMIAGMYTPTVSLVLGGGHSIGIPLAVSADVSMIVPSASMTVHPVRTNGLVLGVPQTVTYFEKIQERVNQFIMRNSHISAKTLDQMLLNTQELATDIGTVISGEEAVACGLIDRLGTLHGAVETLYHLIETAAPRYPDA